MAAPRADVIWMDGEWVAWDDARVHLLTHTLHYGFGVFEGTRAYRQSGGGTAIFRLRDHLRRFVESAHILDMGLPFDRDELLAASREMVVRNGFESCYLRHLAFIGHGVMGLDPKDNPVRVAIAAWPWGPYLGEDALSRGIRCRVASYSRQFPNSTMMRAKACGNYVVAILAKREAVRQGYQEAILLDTQGFVAEGSGENIFVVRDGRVRTPPPNAILQGLTRDTIMHLAARNGLPVEEAHVSRDDLYVADEVFMTGTAAEVTPVREIDDRAVGDGRPGPVTRTLQEQFFRLVRGEIRDLAGWLEPVDFG